MAIMVRFSEYPDMFIVPFSRTRLSRLLPTSIHEACQAQKAAVYYLWRRRQGQGPHQDLADRPNEAWQIVFAESD
jgi:hypothetical protein